MENPRPIRTIYFQIQGKGGTGKSFLTYLLANKFRHEKDSLFIDADTELELLEKFSIKSVPTYILLENGEEVNRMNGAKTKEQFLEFVNLGDNNG